MNSNAKENVNEVMKDLEKKVNPVNKNHVNKNHVNKDIKINANEVASLLQAIQSGSTEFEERVGRPMTYSEMRSMWG